MSSKASSKSMTKKVETPVKKSHEEEEEDNDEVEVEVLEDNEDKTTTTKKVEIAFDTSAEGFALLHENTVKIDQLNRTNKTIIKLLEKKVTKELKQLKDNKKKKSNPDKPKSGFVKKRDIPQAFITFYEEHLKKEKSFQEEYPNFDPTAQLARTDVTKMIYYYIKAKSLYDGDNKRVIVPNKAIKNLFGIKDNENITFSSFQTFTSRLYKSDEDNEESEVEAEEDAAVSEEEETVVEKKVKTSDKKKTVSAASNK